ncbi:MAG: helix-turn-helix domain-containing protein [Treponema sp.]|jgi:AraC-like DNA-binding protein|nr:helix-turn-helix domain-containing protein [Treponema sp.]
MTQNATTIILRREIEPVLLKAREVIRFYEKAVNVTVSVLDRNGRSIPGETAFFSEYFCSLCRQYSRDTGKKWAEGEYPCTHIHLNAISRAQHSRGGYIYTCDLGFVYWVCSLSSGERPAGALIAGLALGISREEAAGRISERSGGKISLRAAEMLLEGVEEKTADEIKAMARLLAICARQISRRSETLHETLKRRALQQYNLLDRIEDLKNKSDDGPEYPMDKERHLLDSLRRGDNEGARKALDELLARLFFSAPDNFKFLQYRAIELAILFSRTAVSAGNVGETLPEISNRYLERIQEAQGSEELVDMLYQMVDAMTEQISPFKGVRHALSLRKAECFIQENFTRKVRLKEVADVSGLSAPYFSTVFKEEMGENLSDYLNRLRVDRAAKLLMDTDLSLSEIAGSCGFEDQSWFSKIFKSYTGLSPGKYRDNNRIPGTALLGDNLPVDHPSMAGGKNGR